MSQDLLIVGGGLAGTMFAWKCYFREVQFLLTDKREKETASRVAAGIINSVAGLNVAMVHGGRPVLEEAVSFYQKVESVLGEQYFFNQKIIRLATDDRMESRMKDRVKSDYYSGLGRLINEVDGLNAYASQLTKLEVSGGGRLEVERFLDDSWEFFREQGKAERAELDANSIRSDSGICWNNRNFDSVVFCMGVNEIKSGLFGGDGFRPARGEILDIEMEGLPSDMPICVYRKWLLPIGEIGEIGSRGVGRYRLGATYDLKDLDSENTEIAKNELVTALEEFCSNSFRVVGQRSGVRPVYRRGLPITSAHSSYDSVFMFNGLGSKGCLHGPTYAEQLLNTILCV